MQRMRSVTVQDDDSALCQMYWDAIGGPVAGGMLIRLRSTKRRGSEGSCVAEANFENWNSGVEEARPKPALPAKAQAGDDCSGSGSGVFFSCSP